MTETSVEGDIPTDINIVDINKLASIICANEAPNTDFEIALKLVDSPTMREYNRIYRGVDSTTDVLSFEGETLSLGIRSMRICDIVIDTKQVLKQKGSNTFKEEFWQVLIHALLHITGYDHIKPADKKRMEDAEENYRIKLIGGFRSGY